MYNRKHALIQARGSYFLNKTNDKRNVKEEKHFMRGRVGVGSGERCRVPSDQEVNMGVATIH